MFGVLNTHLTPHTATVSGYSEEVKKGFPVSYMFNFAWIHGEIFLPFAVFKSDLKLE
jgi:hypothetical protein